MAGPLAGWRVIVTRARAQSSSLVELLVDAGACPVELPAIEIADPIDGGAALEQALSGIEDFEWVVFTSANAVERCWRHLGDVAALGGAKVAAIGEGTAAALAEHGIAADLVPERFVAESLVDAFPAPARLGEAPVLLPCAAEARDVLADGLRAKGWRVEVVEAYRTVVSTFDESGFGALDDADAITFTSSSTVTGYLELAGAGRMPPVVACIGPVTARTAMKAGLQRGRRGGGAHRRRACGGSRRVGQAPRRAGWPEVGWTKWVSLLADCARSRRLPAMRRLVAESSLGIDDLVAPLFVRESIDAPVPIASLPGVSQHTVASLVLEAKRLASLGIGALVLFGVPTCKDPVGSGASDRDGVVQIALRQLRDDLGDEMVLIADLCLDEYTDHGHCGVLNDRGEVDNDATLVRYGEVAVAQAEAGAHLVAPSGMMDGQVAAIRAALDTSGHDDVGILAYSAKYASALYGPFRDAVDVTIAGGGDRKGYQQDPRNRREALEEVRLDIAEGADLVMVKPALAYLDVIAAVRAAVDVPVAAYNVSGEYAMVVAAAERGWIDRQAVALEHLGAIKRAGADVILTYFAAEVAEVLGG